MLLLISFHQLFVLNLLQIQFTPTFVPDKCVRVSSSCVSIITETFDIFGVHCVLPTACGPRVLKNKTHVGFLSNYYTCARTANVDWVRAYTMNVRVDAAIVPAAPSGSDSLYAFYYRNDSAQHCFAPAIYRDYCSGMPTFCPDGRSLDTIPMDAISWKCAGSLERMMALIPLVVRREPIGILTDSCIATAGYGAKSRVEIPLSGDVGNFFLSAFRTMRLYYSREGVSGLYKITFRNTEETGIKYYRFITGNPMIIDSKYLLEGRMERNISGTVFNTSADLSVRIATVANNLRLCGLYEPESTTNYRSIAINGSHYVRNGVLYKFENYCSSGVRVLTDAMGVLNGLIVLLEFLTSILIYMVSALLTALFEVCASLEDVLHTMIDLIAHFCLAIIRVVLERLVDLLSLKTSVLLVGLPCLYIIYGLVATVLMAIGIIVIEAMVNIQ